MSYDSILDFILYFIWKDLHSFIGSGIILYENGNSNLVLFVGLLE